MQHAIPPHPLRLQLGKRELLAIDAGTAKVVCESGSVWITQDRDRQDIVLDAGESFTPATGRGAIVYALDPAALRVYERAAPAPQAGRALWPGLRAWWPQRVYG